MRIINTTMFPISLIKCFVLNDDEGNNTNLLHELLSAIEESCHAHPQLLEDFTISINDLIVVFEKCTADPSLGGITPPTLELPPMVSLEIQFKSRISLLRMVNEDTNRLIIILINNNNHYNVILYSPEYWLTTPSYDETQLEPDRVIIIILLLLLILGYYYYYNRY